MLLEIVKQSIAITTTHYDLIMAQLINAAVYDLMIAGIPVSGVSVSASLSQQGVVTVTDASTLTDPALIRAICAYVRYSFGSPSDYDRLKACYDEYKAQLQTATGYGMEDDYV